MRHTTTIRRAARRPRRMLTVRAALPLLVGSVLALSAAAFAYSSDTADMRAPAERAAAPAPDAWKPTVARTKTIAPPPVPRATMRPGVISAPTEPVVGTAVSRAIDPVVGTIGAGTAAAAADTSAAPDTSATPATAVTPDPTHLPPPPRETREKAPGLHDLDENAVAVARAARFLRRLAKAQGAFAADALVDEDHDRRGEFAGLAELTGAESGRMQARLTQPALAVGDARLDSSGVLELGGYLFRVYLPSRFGDAVAEPSQGFGAGMCEPDLAERAWSCYAWPVEHGKTGSETYFIGHEGVLLVTDTPDYSGRGRAPAADATRFPGASGGPAGALAAGREGADGHHWRILDR